MTEFTQPTLTIDLGAIVANFRQLNQRSGGRCAAVIKANMYGLAAFDCLPQLEGAGCSDFFVATAAEAQAARPWLGNASNIYILNAGQPVTDCGRQVINSLADCQHATSIHAFHIDTGMNRFGLSPNEVATLDVSKLAPGCLVMSHFSEAEAKDSAVTAAQIGLFNRLVQSIRNRLDSLPSNITIRTSLANSAGMFVPGAQSDLPRPGYALYGGNPTPWSPGNPMQSVVTLHAPVAQARRLVAGTRVGYNGTWTASADCWVATIGVGYGDGWLRSNGQHAQACFREQIVPVVGRISMDSMVICTGDSQPEVGETIALIDGSADLNIDAVAARAGTIGYEVLTSLGMRYQRRYVWA